MTAPNKLVNKSMKLMGNRFEISAICADEAWAEVCIDAAVAEISRIERLLTTYREDSDTNLINQNAGIAPVRVSKETLDLIQRSLRISRLTQGAFDITYGSVDKRLWNFDPAMTALPDAGTAKRMVRLINYRNVVVDEAATTVFLKEAGMRIGFGGIGKGYAAEMAKRVMQQRGVESGIVNASGDLAVWGRQADERPWNIGIVNPNGAGQIFSFLELGNMAVATSGNYEKFVTIGGKRYSHTIDPRTGLPVTGVKSVTILCSNAEIADAMATPVMIMGVRAGLDLIDQMEGIEAIIVDDANRIHTSKNIRLGKCKTYK